MEQPYLKKSLGQHFLHDENILRKIADAAGDLNRFKTVVEVGPGMGALTKHLLEKKHPDFYVVELDDRWAAYLADTYPALKGKVLHEDILKTDLRWMKHPSLVLGNFPYNISSQIIFKILDYKDVVTGSVGMFQKEMARRICAGPGSKEYGVISVLTQAWYDCKYLFDVGPECFDPPPKVVSGVIELKRKDNTRLDCDEELFKKVVKAAFNQRRKTMRNSLKELMSNKSMLSNDIFNLRPEQIGVERFVELTKMIASTHQ